MQIRLAVRFGSADRKHTRREQDWLGFDRRSVGVADDAEWGMSMKPGEDLEDLTEAIFRVLTSNPFESGHTVVERDVRLDGADGPRQIDLVIRTTAGPIQLTTIIECKDYARRVSVTTVDALHSVAQDVNASRAVLVSRGGFSRTAVQKAKRLGIALYTADRVMNVTEEMFQVPVHVREIRPTNVRIQGNVRLKAGDQVGMQNLVMVNGHNLLYLLRDHLIADQSLPLAEAGDQAWVPSGVGEPTHIKTAAGDERSLENLKVIYSLAERHYFGYLGDVSEAMLLYDELESTSQLLVKAESLMTDYVTDFVEFDSMDLPVEPVLTAYVAVVPDPDTDMLSGYLDMKRLSW